MTPLDVAAQTAFHMRQQAGIVVRAFTRIRRQKKDAVGAVGFSGGRELLCHGGAVAAAGDYGDFARRLLHCQRGRRSKIPPA